MPSWDELQKLIHSAPSSHDAVRRRFLKELFEHTGRNVILYYSGWLEKDLLLRQGLTGFEVNDSDKTGFMSTVHGMDRSKGLDLILHTPGGNVAATESLVSYLRAMFDTDIRVIIPQLAMSAGTMIALSAREIIMGKHSSLGPIDPQLNGIPAHGVVEEFNRAVQEVTSDPARIPIWQPIIAKYHPTLVGECEKAISWAEEIVRSWLQTGMLAGDPDAAAKARKIVEEFGSHSLTFSHDRHLSADKARQHGVKVLSLEDDQELQELVLSVHHACTLTMTETQAFKLIENHEGVAMILSVNLSPLVSAPLAGPPPATVPPGATLPPS